MLLSDARPTYEVHALVTISYKPCTASTQHRYAPLWLSVAYRVVRPRSRSGRPDANAVCTATPTASVALIAPFGAEVYCTPAIDGCCFIACAAHC